MNKEILIAVKMDPNGGRQAKALTENLIRDSKKLQQAQLEGGRKVLEQIKQQSLEYKRQNEELTRLSRKMAEMGKMRDNVSRLGGAHGTGMAHELGLQMQGLQRRYDRYAAGGTGAQQSVVAATQQIAAANVKSAEDCICPLLTDIRDILAKAHGRGGSGGGGDGGLGGGSGGGQGGINRQQLMALGAVISQTVVQAFGMYQQSKTLEQSNVAQAAQSTIGHFARQYMSGYAGDVEHMRRHGERVMEASGRGPMYGQQAVKGALAAGKIVGGVVVGVGGTPLTGPAGAAAGAAMVASGVADAGNIFMKLKHQGVPLAEVQTIRARLDAERGMDPVRQMAEQMMVEEASLRAQGNRQLMGTALKARGLGAGFGRTFAESVGFAGGMQRLGGMTGLWDKKSTHLTGLGVPKGFGANAKFSISQPGTASYDLERTGADAQYPLGRQVEQLPGKDIGSVTTRKIGLARTAMMLAGHGIAEGVAQGSVASIFQAIGGEEGQKDAPLKILSEAVARGTKQGFTDPRTREELVRTLGTFAEGRVISDGGEGLQRLGAFMGLGADKKMSLAQVTGRQAFVSHIESLGNNPWFQGTSMASAKEILGGDATAAGMMGLGSATPQELIAGSRDLSNLGVTSSQRLSLLKTQMGRMIQTGAMNRGMSATAALDGGTTTELALKGAGIASEQGMVEGAKMWSALNKMGDLSTVSDKDADKFFQKNQWGGSRVIAQEEAIKGALEKVVKEIQATQGSVQNAVDEFKILMRESKALGDAGKGDIVQAITGKVIHMTIQGAGETVAVPPAGKKDQTSVDGPG